MAEISSLNKVMLIGRLGKDPEVRYTSNGDAVADLSLATSEKFKSANGQATERTEWHKLIVWRQTAEFAKQYLKKGQLVYAEGKITTRKWQDKEGNNRYNTEIQVRTLTALGSLGGGSNSSNQQQQQSAPNSNPSQDDDIPF